MNDVQKVVKEMRSPYTCELLLNVKRTLNKLFRKYQGTKHEDLDAITHCLDELDRVLTAPPDDGVVHDP